MKLFEIPEIDVIKISVEDVITTSYTSGGNANEGGAGEDEDM